MINLHRTSKDPDWKHIKPARRNLFQHVASATNGIVTPANIISVTGFLVVLGGLAAVTSEYFWLGFVLLVAGRLLDIVDGYVADKTGTKSPLGEMVDTIIDKVVTFLTVLVFIVNGVSEWWIIVGLALPQLLIALLILYKRQKGVVVHPTIYGKFSMGLAWAGIGGLLLLKAIEGPRDISLIVFSVVGASIALGMYALWQYASGRD